MSFLYGYQGLIPVAVLTGLGADGLLHRLKPSAARVEALRLFAAGVPLVWYSLYFLALHLTHWVWWSVHLWAGAIVVTGLSGWLVSTSGPPTGASGGRRRLSGAEPKGSTALLPSWPRVPTGWPLRWRRRPRGPLPPPSSWSLGPLPRCLRRSRAPE
jgi:hypothetical protein